MLADSLREMPYGESRTIHSDPDFPHAYYADSAVLSELDVPAAGELLALTGPDAPSMYVVQVNHLGGALAGPRPNAVPYREGRFLLRVLGGVDDPERELLHRALALVEPWTMGRASNFAYGAGDRAAEGLYDAETHKRLAGLKSVYDPANLFRGNYGVVVSSRA